MPSSATIAYFITPHGFGHASRSAAVMAELIRIRPGIRFELFTTCPREIFDHEMPDGFGYHAVAGDIGMVQTSPLLEDLPATCDALDQMLPFDDQWVDALAGQLIQMECQLVVCDIAALGIVAARKASITSLLVENFTWDWIYQGYPDKPPGLDAHIRYLADTFARADHHVQTSPLCRTVSGSQMVGPISRQPRTGADETRERLNIPADDKMVLVTMGGVPDDFDFLSGLPGELPCHLVIPGARSVASPHDQVILLPAHSNFYHPDLMQAADALVGKAGYSTIAEAYHLGIPFGYVKRPHSPESAVLENYIARHLPSHSIDTEAYLSGRWIDQLPALLNLTRSQPTVENGGKAVAQIIDDLITE